ncbi:PhnB protein [Paenibacillus pasadenensis]|uniref:PhnB protein n=1 Tax=Paenibacillus pasadenensis TaxID=217090 RepID=A0A2N5NCJ0_9BACL|nr:PhnB protein [Paenibacillus pasadenensis]
MNDVYEAVVPAPLFELHQSDPNPRCLVGRGIQPALNEIYSETEDAVQRQLGHATVADLMVSPSRPCRRAAGVKISSRESISFLAVMSISMSSARRLYRNPNCPKGRMMNMTAKLNTYLHSEDARTQAAFYAQALGGEILSTMTYGQVPGTPESSQEKVMHMVLSVAGGNILFLSDSPHGSSPGGRFLSLALTFDEEAEARRSFESLVQGGTERYPFERQPWGSYYGEIEDKFGVNWQIVKQ